MSKYYNIGITCIGTGVGQSVIHSCRLSRLPIKTIGLGNNPFAYGAYDCDTYDYTPTIYSPEYIDSIIDKCKKHEIDLLIPGCDDDALILAKNMEKMKKHEIKIICADEELITICRNKDWMSEYFNNSNNVFAKNHDKNSLEEDIKSGKIAFPFIAKPRGGFGSRGIEIIRRNEDLHKIMGEHIIQELLIPTKEDPNYDLFMQEIQYKNPQVSEISIQMVFDTDGNLMGKMASYNKLKNGFPIEIVLFENDYVWGEVDKIVPGLIQKGLKGPMNIQGRLTENGFKIFEMNPRFTGITGLRALMGFNEVEACIKNWLDINDGRNSLEINFNRFGVCQATARVVSIERNQKIYELYCKLNKGKQKKKKTLLITGACGYLGQNFIEEASKDDRYQIWAFNLDKERANELFRDKVDECFDKNDFKSGALSLGNVDILLHFGFARVHRGNHQIADSLAFTSELFTHATKNHVPAIVNISSQSVYGEVNNILPDETTPVSPQNVYAQAKYSAELMLKSARETNNQVLSTSLRLATLTGGQKGLVENELVAKFVKQALIGDTITIEGGNQQIERLDIRDAACAILSLLEMPPHKWQPIYNLGSMKIYNILELAKKTVDTVSLYIRLKKSKIIILDKDIKMKTGMDSSRFFHDTNWSPKYDIDETILSLVRYFKYDMNNHSQRPYNIHAGLSPSKLP